MSYRKITVDNKEYEYVVGKTHIKVKGLGVWLKEEVGHLEEDNSENPIDGVYGGELSDTDFVVRVHPSDIAAKIKSTVR